MSLSRIDPSLALGFYFANSTDFDAFCTRLSHLDDTVSRMFQVCETEVDSREHTESLPDEDEFVVL